MTSGPKINLKIGSLVLHGATQAQAVPLVAALKRELGRLLASPGGRAAALTRMPARRGQIDAGTFASASASPGPGAGGGGAAATDGGQIARNLYHGITGGRSP
jgi:hypothetical protein